MNRHMVQSLHLIFLIYKYEVYYVKLPHTVSDPLPPHCELLLTLHKLSFSSCCCYYLIGSNVRGVYDNSPLQDCTMVSWIVTFAGHWLLCLSHFQNVWSLPSRILIQTLSYFINNFYGELTSWEVDLVGVELMGVDFVGVDLVGMNPTSQSPSPTVSVVILSPIKISSFLFVLCDFKLTFTCRDWQLWTFTLTWMLP